MDKIKEEQTMKEHKERIIAKLKDASGGIITVADNSVGIAGNVRDIALNFTQIVNAMRTYYPINVINELVKFGLDNSNFKKKDVSSNSNANANKLKLITELLNTLQELKDELSK